MKISFYLFIFLSSTFVFSCSGWDTDNVNAPASVKPDITAENENTNQPATHNPVVYDEQIVFANYESKYVFLNAVITFSTELQNGIIYVGSSTDPSAAAPDLWVESDSLTITTTGTVKTFARVVTDGIEATPIYNFVYQSVDAFPGVDSLKAISGTEGIDFFSANNESIIAWASQYSDILRGFDRSGAASYDDPSRVYGKSSNTIYNLGNTGYITLTFEKGIRDGDGPDFAVFENGFLTSGGLFAEYGYVEVSSDGINFLRFDTATIRDPASVPDPSPVMCGWNTCLDFGVMGRYPGGYGTAFDLAWLKNKKEVGTGIVDLNRITHVRIADIIGIDEPRLYVPLEHNIKISSALGNYDSLDSFGNVIFDDYPTTGTGGVDLDAVGIINEAD